MLLHQILTLWCSLADGPSMMLLRSCSEPALPKSQLHYLCSIVHVYCCHCCSVKSSCPGGCILASRLCYWESHVSSNPWPPATIPACNCKAATPFQKTQWHSLALHCPEHAKLFTNVKMYCWRIAGSQCAPTASGLLCCNAACQQPDRALKTFAVRPATRIPASPPPKIDLMFLVGAGPSGGFIRIQAGMGITRPHPPSMLLSAGRSSSGARFLCGLG